MSGSRVSAMTFPARQERLCRSVVRAGPLLDHPDVDVRAVPRSLSGEQASAQWAVSLDPMPCHSNLHTVARYRPLRSSVWNTAHEWCAHCFSIFSPSDSPSCHVLRNFSGSVKSSLSAGVSLLGRT